MAARTALGVLGPRSARARAKRGGHTGEGRRAAGMGRDEARGRGCGKRRDKSRRSTACADRREKAGKWRETGRPKTTNTRTDCNVL